MGKRKTIGKPTVLAGASGAAVSAALYYLFDPSGGRARRARMADQARAAARRAREATNAKLDLATDKAMGAVAGALPDDTPPNDQALMAKVRSEALGARWRSVSVDAADGVVTLRGELPDDEQIEALEDAVSGVTGVEEVNNLVHRPGESPANIAEARRASSAPRR